MNIQTEHNDDTKARNNFVSGNNVYILGKFDEEINQYVIPQFTDLIKQEKDKKEGKIYIHINSQGGYTDICDALISLVRLAKKKDITVYTLVTGSAFSAGSMLAVTGTHRYISQEAEHLIHYGSQGSRVQTPLQVERQSERMKRVFERMVSHYKEFTSVPDIRQKIKDDDFFIPSEKCIEWNVADDYIENMEV